MSASEGIRPARAAEAPAIARLIRDSKYGAMPWLATPHTLEEDEGWVAGVLLPYHEVSVAVDPDDDDAIVAVMALSPGWVNQLYVAASHQRRGVGSRMLRLAQDAADADLELWTFQRNAPARAFYERHGFVEVGGTDGDNEEAEPDVHYRWKAGSA